MFSLNNILQKAQSLIDPSTSPISKAPDKNHSKAALFRLQFRLPDSQNPLCDITAELLLKAAHKPYSPGHIQSENSHSPKPSDVVTYVGKLHLSESFLCFSTQPTSFQPNASLLTSSGFTGQTHGAGPAGNGFTLPLCAIRRVERLDTQNSLFSLAITTWSCLTALSKKQGNADGAQKFTVQLAGSRHACERFCDGLKKGLREGVREVDNLKAIIRECYSEYLLSGNSKSERNEANNANGIREPPDAGLGMVFRYPGDARKLRDRSKMRLWGEYLRGWLLVAHLRCKLKSRQRMAEMPL